MTAKKMIFLAGALVLVITVLVAGCGDSHAASAWAMSGHDPQHTGRSSYVGSATNSLKWSYTTGEAVFSSPAIASDGTIYVGSDDRKLYALDPNGTLKWSYTTEKDVHAVVSSPAIASDGTIYVGGQGLKLYALNSKGTLKWSCAIGGFINTSPAIASDGTIYIGSSQMLNAVGR